MGGRARVVGENTDTTRHESLKQVGKRKLYLHFPLFWPISLLMMPPTGQTNWRSARKAAQEFFPKQDREEEERMDKDEKCQVENNYHRHEDH